VVSKPEEQIPEKSLGEITQVLLVSVRRYSVALLSLLILQATPAAAQTVDASQYHAFWLWSGVRPQPVLSQARSLYILQGQISAQRYSRDPTARFIAQGPAVPKGRQGEIWLSYRAQTLDWNPAVYASLLAQLQRWRQRGNALHGIQIDFDARTRNLHEYLDFLRDLRQRLPNEYRLSITGLLDWSAHADLQVLDQLHGVIDEIVVQTYQGRQTISNYTAYLPQVSRLKVPFKIGLLQHGEWQEPAYLAASPWFRGYVVFLQNP
jgi:hypothetical protein